jgi:hypothetical protein
MKNFIKEWGGAALVYLGFAVFNIIMILISK